MTKMTASNEDATIAVVWDFIGFSSQESWGAAVTMVFEAERPQSAAPQGVSCIGLLAGLVPLHLGFTSAISIVLDYRWLRSFTDRPPFKVVPASLPLFRSSDSPTSL